MASVDFYALKEDMQELVHFLFEETDVRIFESYSQFDSELREFNSFDELASAFSLGEDRNGQGGAVLLELWSPKVMPQVDFQRIALTLPGHTFRYQISGVGLIQLYLGGRHQDTITDSHYGHWNEAGARQRGTGDPDTVDWHALLQLSGRIQRHLRNRLAAGKVRGRPILRAAFAAVQGGLGLRYSSLRFYADSPEIQLARGTPA